MYEISNIYIHIYSNCNILFLYRLENHDIFVKLKVKLLTSNTFLSQKKKKKIINCFSYNS